MSEDRTALSRPLTATHRPGSAVELPQRRDKAPAARAARDLELCGDLRASTGQRVALSQQSVALLDEGGAFGPNCIMLSADRFARGDRARVFGRQLVALGGEVLDLAEEGVALGGGRVSLRRGGCQ
jgi:hypothetical protein